MYCYVVDFNVSVNKTLINNETIYVGDVVEFNITVTNDGLYVLDKVVVFDDNYTGLVLITGSYGKWTYNNGSWIYNGSLAAGVNFKMPFFYKNIFSGRDAIWYEFFTLFIKKPLTGIGTNVTIQSFFEYNATKSSEPIVTKSDRNT